MPTNDNNEKTIVVNLNFLALDLGFVLGIITTILGIFFLLKYLKWG